MARAGRRAWRRLIDDLLSLSRIELNEHIAPHGGAATSSVAVLDVADALSLVLQGQIGRARARPRAAAGAAIARRRARPDPAGGAEPDRQRRSSTPRPAASCGCRPAAA